MESVGRTFEVPIAFLALMFTLFCYSQWVFGPAKTSTINPNHTERLARRLKCRLVPLKRFLNKHCTLFLSQGQRLQAVLSRELPDQKENLKKKLTILPTQYKYLTKEYSKTDEEHRLALAYERFYKEKFKKG